MRPNVADFACRKTRGAPLLLRAFLASLIRIREHKPVSGRPAEARQRDLKQVIAAATKAGAKEVRVKLSGGAEVVIPLVPDDDNSVAPEEQITL